MLLCHIEALPLRCPRCRRVEDGKLLTAEIGIGEVFHSTGDDVLEGRLDCADDACGAVYPIIDGVPILVPDVRSFLEQEAPVILERDDLHELTLAFLDPLGRGTPGRPGRGLPALSAASFEALADSLEPETDEPEFGREARRLAAAFATHVDSEILGLGGGSADLALDLLCGVGRRTVALAGRATTAVGLDPRFEQVREARRWVSSGTARHVWHTPDGRFVWDTYEVDPCPNAAFLVADPLHPPLADGRFALGCCLDLPADYGGQARLLQVVADLLADTASFLVGFAPDVGSGTGATPEMPEAFSGRLATLEPEAALRRLLVGEDPRHGSIRFRIVGDEKAVPRVHRLDGGAYAVTLTDLIRLER